MRLRHLTLLWIGCAPGCALVSGLSSLDVAADASVAPDGASVDVASSETPIDGAAGTDGADGGDVTLDASVDAAVVDSGSPSVLRCGASLTCNFATQTCCSVGNATSCILGTASTCTADGGSAITIHCDYSGQCGKGEVCCGKFGGPSTGTSTCTLPADCPGFPGVRLCRTSAECADAGVCTALPAQTNLAWLSYCK